MSVPVTNSVFYSRVNDDPILYLYVKKYTFDNGEILAFSIMNFSIFNQVSNHIYQTSKDLFGILIILSGIISNGITLYW